MRRAAPVFLDLQIRRQSRDLGAGLRRVRLVGARLQQERRRAAAHELAADREDEVAAEHVVAEFLDDLRSQRRIALEHELREAGDDLGPRIAVLVHPDGVLQNALHDSLEPNIAQGKTQAPAKAAAKDVKASMA